MSKQDTIYAAQRNAGDFVFDNEVAEVFTDMINRSVPGYATIISMIGVLANRYCRPGTNVYDLGCSLGGASFSMCHHIEHDDYKLLAIDNSRAMIERFEQALKKHGKDAEHIELKHADINDCEIKNASVVVLNFTLQFIPVEQREALMAKIYSGMRPGGILILSEKIRFPDDSLDELLIDMYHQFKQAQGYSALEVAQKRAALEKVLIPETIDCHKNRIAKAGFKSCDTWFQCFNFTSLLAIK
ncbi:MAG: carboxy-S-adenosyl-L-methionine synthase CmoA [Pseudohongiellaceae bacterium]|nr:carboxy-S-adenosyl-L-methionine synthase CmoA [Pseudohongiellaceae bacterium]